MVEDEAEGGVAGGGAGASPAAQMVTTIITLPHFEIRIKKTSGAHSPQGTHPHPGEVDEAIIQANGISRRMACIQTANRMCQSHLDHLISNGTRIHNNHSNAYL